MEISARMQEHSLLAKSAAAGSMVLLKNVQNTLPFLPENDQPLSLAVFGVGQVRTVLSVDMKPWRSVSVLEGLCDCSAVKPDGLLAHKYRNFAVNNTTGEMPLDSISMDELAGENAAAVVVISRKGDSDATALTPLEVDMIGRITDYFTRTVLIINTPSYLDIGPVSSLLGAVVYMGIAGQEAGSALADLLAGETIFSGRLAFSWPVSGEQLEEMNHVHDVFSGYRFYDSFGEDVLYPFGFGLDYGTSTLSAFSAGLDGSTVCVEAEVENVGEVYPVRSVVQVYFSQPNQNGTQPLYQLDCFQKTTVLLPGDTQKVEFSFPVTEMSLFQKSSNGFVLKEGHYDIRIGTNCRSTAIAGSIYVPKELIVSTMRPLLSGESNDRLCNNMDSYTYATQEEEQATARGRAMRLPTRQMLGKSVRYGKKPVQFPRADDQWNLAHVAENACTLQELVASLSTEDLTALVSNWKGNDSDVIGAWGATTPLASIGLGALAVGNSVSGLQLPNKIVDEEGHTVIRRHLSAFPSPSALACSFDRELMEAVGVAMGREALQWGMSVLRVSTASVGAFSEDPVLNGLCAGWLIAGCQRYLPVVLPCFENLAECSEKTQREMDLLSYEIALKVGQPAVLELAEGYGLDAPLIGEVLRCQYHYKGAITTTGDSSRVSLEQAAVVMLQLLVAKGAYRP